MLTKKQIAQNFLTLAAKGDSQIAFSLYVGEGFKHHNAYFKGDAQTLIAAMAESAEKHPNTILDIKHVLEDGNLVAVHSRIQKDASSLGMAVMHIFRFENDKIVELWDFGQAVPTNSVNEFGMF